MTHQPVITGKEKASPLPICVEFKHPCRPSRPTKRNYGEIQV